MNEINGAYVLVAFHHLFKVVHICTSNRREISLAIAQEKVIQLFL